MLYLGDEHDFSKTADKMVTFCEETLKEVSLRGAGGGGGGEGERGGYSP